MSKIIFATMLSCSLFVSVVYGQERSSRTVTFKKKHTTINSEKKFSVFMNMFSLLEPQQAAVGAGINYRLAKRWEIGAEFNYLFDGFWQGGDDYHSKGYRGILTAKRFSRSGIFFYGIDARIKYFSFVDTRNFVNIATADTLYNFSHTASNLLLGAAMIVGVRLPISKNKRWAFEFNTGIGWKYRFVNRKNIPGGYEYDKAHYFPREYNFTSDQDVSGETFYAPSGIRVLYFFN